MSVKEKMTAIADEIRAKTGEEELLTIDEMSENIQDVYDAGKQTEYDAFWDAYQNYGKRTNYNYAFYGNGWTDETFKPKYNITIGSEGNTMTNVFQGCRISDLAAIFKEQGIKLECSLYVGSNSVALFSSAAYLTTVPKLEIPVTANYGGCFAWCQKLHTIEELILSEEGTQTFSNTMFYECNSLKNITIKGKIGNDFDIHWSPLTKDSILSIFDALLDTAAEKTVSFSLSAVNTAFETAEGNGDGSTSDEWNELLSKKPNWTVILV